MNFSWLNPFAKPRPLVPVIRLSGMIMASGGFRRGLSMEAVAPLIDKAFGLSRAEAVALLINSPGGSPVQSSLIFERIRHLSKENDIPVLSFVEDVAASGGYWLACAGDEIHVNAASVVGSIGVVSAGFGLDEAISRLGVSRRVYTSGDRKVMLDPFSPENADDVARLKEIQKDVHDQFIAMVKRRRGTRLKGVEDELFSGAFWTGRKAVEFGLVDNEGEMRQVLEDRFGKDVRIRLIERKKSLLGLSSGKGGVGAALVEEGADQLVDTLMERLERSRFGV